MERPNPRVWCWALGPSYIQPVLQKHKVPESRFCSAAELVAYYQCRNVTYFQSGDHTAENFNTLEEFEGVMADVHLGDETRKTERLSELSLQFPNIVGGIVDDLSSNFSTGIGTPQQLRQVATELKSRNPALKLYAVCYTMNFPLDLSCFLPFIDCVILWVWNPADLVNLDAHVDEALRLYQKPMHLGLYLFDYSTTDWFDAGKTGKVSSMPMETLQFQCERAKRFLKEGRIEAIHILGSYYREELETDQARWLSDFCGSL